MASFSDGVSFHAIADMFCIITDTLLCLICKIKHICLEFLNMNVVNVDEHLDFFVGAHVWCGYCYHQ